MAPPIVNTNQVDYYHSILIPEAYKKLPVLFFKIIMC